MPVGFHAVFVFRKAVMFIRNDEPQNVPPGFTDLFQPYAAVLIDTGNHIAVMEGLPALYPHTINLLELDGLENIVNELDKNTPSFSLKEKAAYATSLLRETAANKNISVKLRRKK